MKMPYVQPRRRRGDGLMTIIDRRDMIVRLSHVVGKGSWQVLLCLGGHKA
jgi:hypothetical protein